MYEQQQAGGEAEGQAQEAAQTEAPAASIEDQMLASLDGFGQEENEEAESFADEEGEEPAESEEADETPEELGQKEETIPMSAFKKRLGKETEKRREAQREASEYKLMVQELQNTLRAQAEVFQAQLAEYETNSLFDEKDLELRRMRLTEAMRQKAKGVVDQSRRTREEQARQQAEYESQQAHEALVQDLASQASNLTSSSGGLVQPYELLMAYANQPEGSNASMADIYKGLESANREKVERYYAQQRKAAPAPRSLAPQGARGSLTPKDTSASSMLAFLEGFQV